MGRHPGHQRWFIGHPHYTTLERDRLSGGTRSAWYRSIRAAARGKVEALVGA